MGLPVADVVRHHTNDTLWCLAGVRTVISSSTTTRSTMPAKPGLEASSQFDRTATTPQGLQDEV